jgi:hypothetical protein
MNQKDWPAAIKVYEAAVERFPNDGSLKQNLKYCRQERDRQ